MKPSPSKWRNSANAVIFQVLAGLPADATNERLTGPDGLGFWDDFDVIACRDGKHRRIPRQSQPGLFPLAYGFPRQLGPLLARLEGMGINPAHAKRAVRNARGRLAKAGRNRVGRLHGYGNAIVPQDAAIFIKAFLQTEEENQ